MKKIWTVMTGLILVFCSVFVFAACGKKDEADRVSSITINNISQYYQTEDTVPFSNVTVTIRTTKSGTKVLSHGQFDLDDVDQAEADTEFVIFAQGLSKQTAGALEEGTYNFSVYIAQYNQTFENALRVQVSDDLSVGYTYRAFEQPDFVDQFITNNTNAAKGEQDPEKAETDFAQAVDYYYVGDDNAFAFNPILTLTNKETGAREVREEGYRVNVTVKHGSDDVDVANNPYFTYSQFKFDFTEDAIGEVFTITMVPTDFAELVEAEDYATLTLKVADGYNISQDNVKDLGRMSLVSEAFKNIENVGDVYLYAGDDAEDVYYNPADPSNKVKRASYTIWENYYASLVAQGYTQYADAQPVNGIFIHGDVYVTPSDLPGDYFITADEVINRGSTSELRDLLEGSLQDRSYIYAHYLVDSDFTFNGNLFKISFNGLLKNDGSGDYLYDPIPWGLGNGEDFYENVGECIMGHSKAFLALGKKDGTTANVATFENVLIQGNVSNVENIISGEDEDATSMASGSLIMVTSLNNNTQVKNAIINSALIGMYSEDNKNVDDNNNGLHADYCKVYNCYNCALFCYDSTNNTINHSKLYTFGGPAVFLVSDYDTEIEDNPETPEDETRQKQAYPSECIVDENTIIINKIVGDEAWFGIVGADALIPAITTLNPLFQGSCGITFIDENGKMNMYELSIDGNYLGCQWHNLYTNFQYLGYPLVLNADDPNNPIYYILENKVAYQSPVFMSNDNPYLIGFVNEYHQLIVIDLSNIDAGPRLATQGDFGGSELYIVFPTDMVGGQSLIGITLAL